MAWTLAVSLQAKVIGHLLCLYSNGIWHLLCLSRSNSDIGHLLCPCNLPACVAHGCPCKLWAECTVLRWTPGCLCSGWQWLPSLLCCMDVLNCAVCLLCSYKCWLCSMCWLLSWSHLCVICSATAEGVAHELLLNPTFSLTCCSAGVIVNYISTPQR